MNGRRRREIITNMWTMPIAAHHLAARLIQSVYRGYLLRIILVKDNWWENVERHKQEYLRDAKTSRSAIEEEPVSFKERLYKFIELYGPQITLKFEFFFLVLALKMYAIFLPRYQSTSALLFNPSMFTRDVWL
jgi:hypothetical protein